MTPNTNNNSLKTLSKSILNRLENNKYIVFNPKERGELQEDLYRKLAKTVLTEEDITNQVRTQVAGATDALTEQNITETDAFQSQKRALKARMGENVLHGFYFQDTLRGVCISVRKFLFESPFVEDVFESDEAIQKLVMETIQNFDESKMS
jgi:hypothetical protein